MRRLSVSSFVVCLMVVLSVGVVFALASGPPTDDSYVDSVDTGTTHDDMDLAVEGSGTGCTPIHITYMRWDMSDIPSSETVDSAELRLTANFASATNDPDVGPAKLSLHETGDDWNDDTSGIGDETTLTYEDRPAKGSLIQTVTAPPPGNPPSPATVTFNSSALVDYVQQQADGDGTISFRLEMSDGCVDGGTLVQFEDRESGSDVGPNLQLRNTAAVKLRSFQATNPPSKWNSVLVFTLGLFGLGLIGGLTVKRLSS